MIFQAFKVYLSQAIVATNMFSEKIIQTLTMKDAFQIVNIALHLNKSLKLKEHFILHMQLVWELILLRDALGHTQKLKMKNFSQ